MPEINNEQLSNLKSSVINGKVVHYIGTPLNVVHVSDPIYRKSCLDIVRENNRRIDACIEHLNSLYYLEKEMEVYR
jgi:hypothetical protein